MEKAFRWVEKFEGFIRTKEGSAYRKVL